MCRELPRWHNGKESTCQCRRRRRLEFFPLVRKFPWRRKWQHIPVFLPCLKNSMDRGTWYVTVHGVTESRTWLSNWAHSKRYHDHTDGSWSELAQDTLGQFRPRAFSVVMVWTGPGHTGRYQGSIHTDQQDEAVCVLHPCQLNNILFSLNFTLWSDQIRSVTQSCPTLWEPMNRSTPGLPVHHQLQEFTETHVHRVSDAI